MMRRKQYDELKKLKLTPEAWCHILGVIMYDRDGWTCDGKDYGEAIGLPEFVRRVFKSTVGADDGATDLFDCENYSAEDGTL